MNIKIIVCTLILVNSILGSVPSNTEIPSTDKSFPNKQLYTSFKFTFGEKNNLKNTPAEFMFDIGYKHILIGSQEHAKWGVSCIPENNCQITSDTETSQFYFYKQFFTQKAKAILILDALDQIDTKNAYPAVSSNPLPNQVILQLVTHGNSWNFNNWGVIGLAPFGAFVNYLKSHTKENLSLLLHYQADRSFPAKVQFTTRAFFNPVFSNDQLKISLPLAEGEQHWTVSASLSSTLPEFDFTNEPVCLTNNDDSILVAPNHIDQCNAIKRLICSGLIGDKCTSKVANFNLAPNLDFTIGGIVFSFGYKDYIYAVKNNRLMCRFGNASKLRALQNCNPKSEFAFGKLFFEKFPVIFDLMNNKKPGVTFLNGFNLPDKNNNYTLYQYIFIAIGVCFVVFLLAFIIIGKKRSDARIYPEYDAHVDN